MDIKYRNITFWAREVRNNFNLLSDAISNYKDIISNHWVDVAIVGNISDLIQQQAGIQNYYELIQGDCNSLCKIIDFNLETIMADKFKWFQTYEAKQEYGDLKKTEIDIYVTADEDVKALRSLLLELQELDVALKTIYMSVRNKGFNLAHIKEIRLAGLSEIFVDETRENTN